MRLAFLITKRLWKQLFRDKRTFALATFAPVLFVFMFGIAFGGEIEHLPIIIVNEDEDTHVEIIHTVDEQYGVIHVNFNITLFDENISSIGKSTTDLLIISSKVDVTESTGTFAEAKNLVVNKKYICAVYIPVNFSYNLASPDGENASIELFLDNSNPQLGAVVLSAFQDAFQEAVGEYRSNFDIDVSFAFGDDLATIDFFAPGVIVYGVFFFAFILIIMNLIAERKEGTLPLLLQCPYDKGQIILGYLFAFSLVSMLQTTLIILASSIFFDVYFGTTIYNYVDIYMIAVLTGFTGLVLAIFLSSFARSEFQAVQFIPLVILPLLLLSGIILPLDQIPEIFRWISYLLPTTYSVNLIRSIAIEGASLNFFDIEVLYQLFFVLIFLFMSRMTLRET